MCNLFQRANTKRLHNDFLEYKIISLNDGELQTAQDAVLLENKVFHVKAAMTGTKLWFKMQTFLEEKQLSKATRTTL